MMKVKYHKRMVNIHNTSYVVNIYNVHLIKPRIFASKTHVIHTSRKPLGSTQGIDDIVLVNNSWKK
jgi:hypothetical protein